MNNNISFQGSFQVGVLTKQILKKRLGNEFQSFMAKGQELAQQSGENNIKLNIFSLFPFLSKVKAKFSFVNAEGKKEVQVIKTKLKELKQKPKEFIEKIMTKFEELIKPVKKQEQEIIEKPEEVIEEVLTPELEKFKEYIDSMPHALKLKQDNKLTYADFYRIVHTGESSLPQEERNILLAYATPIQQKFISGCYGKS